MAKFFSWDPERDGFKLHDTAEAARESAEGAIDWYLDDEWDESVEGVCWGEVLGDVTQTITGDCDCTLDDDGTSPHAHHCRYEIEDVENTTADDLRSQLAAANKREVAELREAHDRDNAVLGELSERLMKQIASLERDRNEYRDDYCVAADQRDELRAELAAAKQENARLRELLTEARNEHFREPDSDAMEYCRGCGNHPYNGHRDGCLVARIGAALAATKEKP